MHEFGYCEALLPVVRARAGTRPVARLGVTAGVRHHLVADAMQTAWEHVAGGTPYRSAAVDLQHTLMLGRCRACGHEFPTDDTLAVCPVCDAIGPELEGGDEFVLGWIEYADAGEPDVATATVAGPSADHYHPHEH